MNLHSAFITAALVFSFTNAASIPTLYDVAFDNEPLLEPLNTYTGVVGYEDKKMASALPPAEQTGGPTVTRYQIVEVAVNPHVDNNLPGTSFLTVSTLLDGSVTRTYTMDQGASTLHLSAPPGMITTGATPLKIIGVVRDCALDLAQMQGACVEEFQIPYLTVFTDPTMGTVTATSTSTTSTAYTRSLSPLQLIASGADATLAPGLFLTSLFVSLGVSFGVVVVMGA